MAREVETRTASAFLSLIRQRTGLSQRSFSGVNSDRSDHRDGQGRSRVAAAFR